jgi:hypothetical protein
VTVWLIGGALLGCRGADPDLAAQARSLEAWEAGQAALRAGDPTTALERFGEAQQARPSPLVGAWEARAMASRGGVGDLEMALARLDDVLRARPLFAEARYNRAAYLLRLDALAPDEGRRVQAAAELQQALADGPHLPPRAVLDDRDFASVLADPAFAFLPGRTLSLTVEPPPETAFWGAEVPLRLHLSGRVGRPIAVSADPCEGPLELVSAIEETGDGDGVVLTWTWRVVGPGRAVIGPFTVRAGELTSVADGITVVASAPPDRAGPSRPLSLAVPSELVAALELRVPRVVDGAVVVRVRPGDRVTVEPPAEPPARYETRAQGEPVDVVWRWPKATPSRVRIRDGSGAEVFSGPPSAN